MKRALLAICIALAGIAIAAPAQAQTAAALGKPLPSPDLPIGTVSVRVVAGSPSSPVSNTEVTLVVNGATRVARTDSAGRAHFKDLPPDAKLQAKVTDEDKKDIASDEFSLPADSGVRLMLSTRPWNPGAGGGPPMAGGAMPNPRAMSGEPRPEQNDSPGTVTVRLSYDDFKDAPPVDVPVVLVGYKADDTVTFQSVKSDKDGRATFKGLDRTGATAYFAMTQLPRNGVNDRLTSTPVMLDPRAGVRMILSSEKRTSTAPPLDDLSKIERQDGAPAAGKIRVALEGAPAPDMTAMLVDAEQKLVIARAKPTQAPPDPTDVQAQANWDDKPAVPVPAGTLRLVVHGGSTTDEPLAGVGVRLVAATAQDDAGTDQKTTASGTIDVTTPIKEPVIAVVTINGKQLRSKPLDLSKSGGVMTVTARWPSEGKPEVVFDLVPRPGQAVYVETQLMGQTYKSLPFQPVPERGTRVTLFIFPRVLFTFSLTSRIDDEYLAVNGRFEVSNNSWSPYVGGPDGLLIPLPKHFEGALVADKDQGDVAVAPGEGYRIVRPIAPGQRTFHGAFSLPVEHGEVTWNLDLPYGAFNSGMEILQVPGMHVETPPGVKGETATVPQGTYFVLPQISILPKQSMVMTISGLPAPAAWRIWMPRIIGVVVILMMIAGVTFALTRTKPDAETSAAREGRRQKLLDELVELEKAGKNEKRREQIMAELEALWDDAA
ncbi:MAG TPA: hypothetical protein VIV40_28685 [Kofleriaceae bacterium]